jgi:DnaJ domain
MWSFRLYSFVAAALFSHGHAFVHHSTPLLTRKQHQLPSALIRPMSSLATGFEKTTSTTTTLYDILGANRTDTRAQLKQRYVELARKCHPDAMRNTEQLLTNHQKITVLKRAKPLTMADKSTLMRMLKDYYTQKYYKMYVPGHESDNVSQERFLESRTDKAERRITLCQFSARVARLKLMDEINEGTKPYSDKLWNRVDQELTVMLLPIKDHHVMGPRVPNFAEIASAWSILSDNRERLRYDRTLAGQDITKKFEAFVGSFFRSTVPIFEAFGKFEFPVVTTNTQSSAATIAQKVLVHPFHPFQYVEHSFNMTHA